MNRFFKTPEAVYEAVRARMDVNSGYPSEEAQTWFTPASDSPHAPDGEVLLACVEPIAAEFVSDGEAEITETEYRASYPEPAPRE
jgi:hypothetical protein